MKLKSESGYSLIEIGIALIIVAIFMVSSITLLSASNENYRRIEQNNIALSYAMQTIEAIQLNISGEEEKINIDNIKTKALQENNMTINYSGEKLPKKDGKDYGDKLQIITVEVEYNIKSEEAGSKKTLTLKTLKVND